MLTRLHVDLVGDEEHHFKLQSSHIAMVDELLIGGISTKCGHRATNEYQQLHASTNGLGMQTVGSAQAAHCARECFSNTGKLGARKGATLAHGKARTAG